MRAESLSLAPTAAIPNHPRFPALIYHGVVAGAGDAAAALEALFARNGWPPQWRNGIYPSTTTIRSGTRRWDRRGRARVLLGGPGGREVALAAGDVAVLPAGTGHCRLAASRDFLVVGAYPPGQRADICREAPTPAMLARIAGLPAPASDPVTGASAGLVALWR